MDQLLQDGSERCDSNSTANKHGNFIAEPVLVTLTKWTIDEHLRERLSLEDCRAEALTEVVGPGSDSTDVKAEKFLMWSRADGEGVELSRVLGCTGDLHPLTSLVVEGDWPLEVHTNNLGRKDVGTNNGEFDFPASHADEEVESIHNAWSKEEVAKERILNETTRSVEESQDIEDDIPVVGDPEGSVCVSPGVLGGEHKDDDCYHGSHEPRKPCHG